MRGYAARRRKDIKHRMKLESELSQKHEELMDKMMVERNYTMLRLEMAEKRVVQLQNEMDMLRRDGRVLRELVAKLGLSVRCGTQQTIEPRNTGP